MSQTNVSSSFRLAVLYAVFGASWIVCSDLLLGDVYRAGTVVFLSIAKGLLFILVTSAALYLMSLRFEAEREKGEERHELLFKRSPQALLLLDSEGQILDANDRLLETLLVSSDELIGKSVFVLAAETDSKRSALREAVRSASSIDFHARLVRNNGECLEAEIRTSPIDVHGSRCVLSAITDITERLRSEEAVRRSEALMRALMEATTDGVFIKDLEGRYLLANDAALQMLGRCREAVIGKRDAEIFQADQAKAFMEGDEPALRGQLGGYEEQIGTRSGERKTFLILKGPMRDSAGVVIGLFGAARDITELKRIEEKLRSSNERLEQATARANDLAALAAKESSAKSYFLANMGHELRTPMNAVIGVNNLLLDTALNDEQRQYAEIVKTSSEALMYLINNVLDYSKIEARKGELHLSDVDLNALIENCGSVLAIQAYEKGLDLVTLIDPGLPKFVRADSGRLSQVVNNLLSNALKFTEHGGVFVHAFSEAQDDRTITLKVMVTDTGAGIAEDKFPLLFQPFTQLDSSSTRRFGGAGLGLAIARELVQQMGGSINVESRINEGSTFSFTAVLEIAVSQMQPAAPSLKGLKILAADHSSFNRQFLSSTLSHFGAVIDEAENSEEFGRLLHADGGVSYHTVMLDVALPGGDVKDHIRALRSRSRSAGAQLVVMAPFGLRADLHLLERTGSYGTLTRPIRRAALLDCMFSVSRTPIVAANEVSPPQPSFGQQRPDVRILVVEDNRINQRVAVAMLGKLGLHADAVENGTVAIAALKHGRYDLVLMDCQMPEMDGYEATRIIRKGEAAEANRLIPIIAMTAHVLESDRKRCLEVGMNDHLGKPIILEDLRAAIARHINFH